MSGITQCPDCSTRFKVSAEQLEAHDGLVRCGRCQHVFNAHEHMQTEEPDPQLSLPIDEQPVDDQPSAEDAGTGDTTVKVEAAEIDADAHEEDSVAANDQLAEPAADNMPGAQASELSPIPDLTELEPAPTTLAQQVQFIEDADTPPAAAPAARRHAWAIWGSTALTLVLAGQATYHFRDDLAVQLPGLKPLLVQTCDAIGCRIGLPRDVDVLSIESSELEADPHQASVITLRALLRNRASHVEAWPSLELTLTDLNDQAIARRAFHPADYLADTTDIERGIGRNREREIVLRLDTSDLKPSGYRLLLFYPQ